MTTQTHIDSSKARKAMIDSQLRTSGVNEEFALARMIAVPREDFLPQDKAALAYIDRSIRVDGGALASPLFYGKVLLEAAPAADNRVLVVEGGTSYLAALVEPMVESLTSVSATDATHGDLDGSYSLIIVDGAIEHLPEPLAQCLEEGGRIVSGLVLRGVTRLATGRKVAGHLSLQPVEDLGIPVLHAFDTPKKWSFA
ncbi:MAG: protein-L-isoaspartate O-methyltransferase [Pseudomonadota bacterium]